MKFLKNKINKINKLYHKKFFLIKSKKISSLLKKLSKAEKIQIYDIGAGLRYLPTLLKFDGISRIHLIDPSQNLQIAYRNLKKLFSDKNSIKKYNLGISDKNEKIYYYPAKVSSGSSFLNFNKKKNHIQYDANYFGSEKPILMKVYDFNNFLKFNRLKKADIVKIDVEGLEFSILKSILKRNKPLIIEVEVNFDNSIIGDTFTKVNTLLKNNNYKLNTICPTYQEVDKDTFLKGDYHNPLSRNPLNQSDLYYILKKKEYILKDLIMMIGYGFIIDAKKEFSKIIKKLSSKNIETLKMLIRILE